MTNSNQEPEPSFSLLIAILGLLAAVVFGFPDLWYFFENEVNPSWQRLKIRKELPVDQDL
ncbi:MAG: hypothetical protein WBA43_22295 [Elainellaceae cyanobacterium]